MPFMSKIIWLMMIATSLVGAADWKPLFNGKNLDGWEVLGDGIWLATSDGVLTGQRNPYKSMPKPFPQTEAEFKNWLNVQSWLYTKEEFEEYDFQIDYWLRYSGNSGISLHDKSRAESAITNPVNYRKTPSKVAYEIQINNLFPDPHPTGSIYGFVDAKTGVQKDNEWNHLEIEVRKAMIRVKLNGQLVAEHAPDPARPTSGPIGIQLHDQYSVAMYRNIKVRPFGK